MGAVKHDEHETHAMILDCILVEVNGDEWKSMEFRFKNTDKDEKEIEMSVGTGFNRNFTFFKLKFSSKL